MVLIGGAVGGALAATSGSSSTPSATASVLPFGPDRLGNLPDLPGMASLGGLNVLHGEFVVREPDGTSQTVDLQLGKAAAVSSGSITVTSADNFTKTYTVVAGTTVDGTRGGIGAVHVGDEVEVLAAVNGTTATASTIRDTSGNARPPRSGRVPRQHRTRPSGAPTQSAPQPPASPNGSPPV